MQIAVFNQEGKEVEKMEAPASVFGVPFNADMLHQVVESQSANTRVVRASTKDRAQVRGGGKNPWRQKGTGRARHGSIRSPIWRGGGVTHGPRKERNFFKKINKKMAARALAMVLSAKAKDGEVVILDQLNIESGKTKDAALIFKNLSGNKTLAGLAAKSSTVILSAANNDERALRNLATVKVLPASGLTAREALATKFLVIPQSSILILEKRLAHKTKTG